MPTPVNPRHGIPWQKESIVTEKEFKVTSGEDVEFFIKVQVYDTLVEMQEKLGADRVFELAQTQNITNERNKARAAATGKMSDKRLTELAMDRVLETDDLRAKYLSFGKDKPAKEAWLDTIKAQIQAENDAERKQRLAAAEKEGAAE